MSFPEYQPPAFRDLGSFHERTLQSFNKVGSSPDTLSAIDPNVVGSFTPI